MLSLIFIVNLTLAVLVLIFGIRYFGLSFALSWFVPLALLMVVYGNRIVETVGSYLSLFGIDDANDVIRVLWIIIIVTTLINFLFATFFTYFFFPILLIAITFNFVLSPFFLDDIPQIYYITIAGIAVIIFWGLLIAIKKLRTFLKAPMIGLLAGTNIFISLILIIGSFVDISTIPLLSLLLPIIIILGTIAIEVFYFAPKMNKKMNHSES